MEARDKVVRVCLELGICDGVVVRDEATRRPSDTVSSVYLVWEWLMRGREAFQGKEKGVIGRGGDGLCLNDRPSIAISPFSSPHPFTIQPLTHSQSSSRLTLGASNNKKILSSILLVQPLHALLKSLATLPVKLITWWRRDPLYALILP